MEEKKETPKAFSVFFVNGKEFINFHIGAKVVWSNKDDPFHPKERYPKGSGPFIVTDIIVHGVENKNPCAIGNMIEQSIRIKEEGNPDTEDHGEEKKKREPIVADVASVFVQILPEEAEKAQEEETEKDKTSEKQKRKRDKRSKENKK